jgi:phage gp46-like protein
MSDAVLSRPEHDYVDFTIGQDGGIVVDDFFDSAILVSIYEEKRAAVEEVEPPELRRGWMGNISNQNNFERGSKIWLYEQSRLDRDIMSAIETAADEALAWFVTDGLALSVVTKVTIASSGAINLNIQLQRPGSITINRDLFLWDNSGKTVIN